VNFFVLFQASRTLIQSITNKNYKEGPQLRLSCYVQKTNCALLFPLLYKNKYDLLFVEKGKQSDTGGIVKTGIVFPINGKT
jgi:hypothetical protein